MIQTNNTYRVNIMNKLLVMGMALLSVLCFSACGHEDGPAENIKGTYIVSRTITMDVPPEYMFEPQYHEVKLVIKAENENFVNITLPAASSALKTLTPSFVSLTAPLVNFAKKSSAKLALEKNPKIARMPKILFIFICSLFRFKFMNALL